MIDKSFVEEIAGLQKRIGGVTPIEVAVGLEDLPGRIFKVVVPDGMKTEDVTDALLKTLPHPQHRAGTVKIASLDSFVQFVNRMKLANTVLFANPVTTSIEAVFDYHDEVNPGWNVVLDPDAKLSDEPAKAHMPMPQWCRFKAVYPFPLHRSYQTWKGSDKKPMTQGDLASFIEDNIIDVHDTHDGENIVNQNTKLLLKELSLKLAGRAKLLSAARGLSIHISEKVGSAVNTQSGEMQIHYEQTHADGASPVGTVTKVDVPSAFIILLPVFNGSDAFELLVRLRYRKDGPTLRWHYDIYNIERAMELAFEDACQTITEGTSVPLFYVNG